MLTMDPGATATMCGIAARANHIGAVRFTRRLASQLDVLNRATGPSVSSTVEPTALFTSTVTPPNRSTVAETSWAQAASSDRSAAWNAASPPAPVIAATAAAPRFASRPVTTTRAPSAANAVAIAFPMPEVEPVTSAISPSRRTAGPYTSVLLRLTAATVVVVASAGAGEQGAGVVRGAAPAQWRRDRRDREQGDRGQDDGAAGRERPLPGRGQTEHDGDHADCSRAERRGAERP